MHRSVVEHPEPDRLAAFGLGNLGAEESADIEQHVSRCESCCRLLEGLADDSVVTLLRAPSGPAVPPELAGHPRYRVLGWLGAGGMATVYRAEHLVMARPVALKVIRRGLLDRPGAVERFGREVRAAARLCHPNIVRAYDAENAGDTHFLVMEFVAGTNLARVIAEQGRLPVTRACEYIRQAALGLQHAFEHGMVHRDIKPQNLMLTPDGQVKILDFGLARFASESVPASPERRDSAPVATEAASSLPATANPAVAAGDDTPSEVLTEAGAIMGSADCIAPEQIDDAHAADIRADVYSLGCTLYHLLAGHPPFPQREVAEKLKGHREQAPKPLSELRRNVPRELARVVERMMAKDPARRYQTPAEVSRALAPFAGAGGASHRKRRALVAVAGLLVMLNLLAYLFGPLVVRFALNRGRLVLDTDDPDAQVLVLRQGNRVATISPRDGGVELPAAEYHLQLVSGRRDLELTPASLTLHRGGTEVAAVRLVPGFIGEVRRLEGHTGWVSSVAMSPDGRRALSGSHDNMIRLWDLERGTELRRLQGHGSIVWSVAFSPDHRYALSGSGGNYKEGEWGAGADNSVRLWDLESGREIRSFNGHTNWIKSVAFLPDGRRAISASSDKSLRMWDVETGQEVRSFLGHARPVMCLAVSSDGRQVLSGDSEGGLVLWDVESGSEIRRLPGHGGNYVLCVALSHDGRRALSGGWDSTLRLWDVKTGKQLNRFDHYGQDGNHVLGVAFCPDDRRAVWVSNGGTVRLRDVAGWKELREFKGHADFVSAVAVSGDGRRAVSGSKDQTVRLWALPPSD